MKRFVNVSVGAMGVAAIGCVLMAESPASSQAGADDVVFKALNDELARSMTLTLDETQSPYFVQYAVADTVQRRIAATCGAIVASDDSHSRRLSTAVRVGYYDMDNTNFAGGGGGGMGGRRGLGGGGGGLSGAGMAALPIEDSYNAIRHATWLATDGAYKSAVETLARKRSFMEGQPVEEERPHDFAKAEAVVKIEPRVEFSLSVPSWEARLRAASARFLAHPHVLDSQISLTAAARNEYLVNSEGTRIRRGDTALNLMIVAAAQAADGALLTEIATRYAPSEAALPSEQELTVLVDSMAERLSGRLSAPKLEHYMGPVLFEGEASPQFFEAMLAPGITGRPDPVGGGRRRFSGAEGLDRYLDKRILPATFQVYDDPRVERAAGVNLAGHYVIDDEGVPAERIDVVVDGRLNAMLMSRAPTAHADRSNGHGRGSGFGRAQASIGCLFVQCTDGVPNDALRDALLQAVKDQKLEFGLRISSISPLGARGGRGGGPGGGAGGAQGGAAVADPIAVYKVYPDGREELVQGCEFGAIEVAVMKDILAAGQEPYVYNTRAGIGAPASIIAPPVLLEEVELFEVEDEPQRLPIVDPPHRRNAAAG